MKAAIPDEPKQAAQDAVSSAKDSLPEAPGNPFQCLFSGKPTVDTRPRECHGFSTQDPGMTPHTCHLIADTPRNCKHQLQLRDLEW